MKGKHGKTVADRRTAEEASSGSIATYRGHVFDPVGGRGVIDPRDLAHALSNICRFGGHTREFYSVAEHSVRVAEICAPQHALWGLLHDAAEAYLGDTVRPIKRQACSSGLVAAEDRILYRLAREFSLPWPMPEPVGEADEILLATEWRDLMGDQSSYRSPQRPLFTTIEPWTPKVAEQAWLKWLKQLMTTHATHDLRSDAAETV